MEKQLYRAAVKMPNGKRKWVSSPTKEGLEQKKEEAKAKAGKTEDAFENATVGKYAEMWYKVYKEPYLRDNSKDALRNVLENHIYPMLKDVPLKSVSQFQVLTLMAPMTKKSKSLNNKIIQALRGIFNTAVDNGLIEKSPVPKTIRIGGTSTKEKMPLTREQTERLLASTKGTRAYLFCLLGLQTGMRRGEICGLMWEDVDLDSKVIHVRHNAILSDTQTKITDTLKTTAAARDIPIPPTLFATLADAAPCSKSEFVLAMDNGKPLTKSSLNNLLRIIENRTVDDPTLLGSVARNTKLVRTLDFHVNPHKLRHTYITRLFESGLDIKEIQYLAGHSTVSMTLKVYTHYQHESRKAETARRVFEALG